MEKTFNVVAVIFLILIIFLQIILESLPVSSSGHLALFSKTLNVSSELSGFHISENLDYLLHGPTIIVLMIVFYPSIRSPLLKLWQTLGMMISSRVINISKHKDSHKKFRKKHLMLLKIFFKIIKFIFIANSITVIIWFLFKNYLKNQAWFNADLTLLFGFCVTAGLLFSLRLKDRNGVRQPIRLCSELLRSGRTGRNTTVKNNIFPFALSAAARCAVEWVAERSFFIKAAILGLAQGFALFPGISRFATVYVTARLLNIKARRAFEITFLLQFPIIVAGFLRGAYKIIQQPGWQKMFTTPVVISIILATIVSVFVLNWCKKLACNEKIGNFSFYMIFPISVLILLILIKN